jgi:crotonobetainyl-CoA:carnitine CoA-transferase CaiB-like acyl-CoA transferase
MGRSGLRSTSVQEQLTGTAGYVGTIMADQVAGMTALYATMMVLFHRERTGQGQEVEVSMFETMAAFMLVEHANGAMFSPPLGPAVYPRAVTPNRKPYRTKDGHVSALVYNDKHLQDVGFFETVDTPNGPVRFPGPPTWFSRTPGRIAGPAPRLGAHTQEVMDELGRATAGDDVPQRAGGLV